MRLISRTLAQIGSPVTAAQETLTGPGRQKKLIDVSQGIPNYPTAPSIVSRVAEAAKLPDIGKYTARRGLPELRELLADEISNYYRGTVSKDQILITSGCNQAFCLVVSALATVGDEIILPVPYYFNHEMWLCLDHLIPVHLQPTVNYQPDPRTAEALLTDRTKAIVLTTPANPTGVTISPKIIHDFTDLAAEHDIALILDETYRCFRSTDAPPHSLFAEPDWQDHIISLHSFSKEFAIAGYRIGSAIAHPDLLAEVAKLFDCVAVCAPRIAQEAAIAALTSALDWRSERAQEINANLELFRSVMADEPGGFALHASGAFFGWVRHPFEQVASGEIARQLAEEQGIVVLPGTAFMPTDERFLRFSVGVLDEPTCYELHSRLKAFTASRLFPCALLLKRRHPDNRACFGHAVRVVVSLWGSRTRPPVLTWASTRLARTR